jgi:hypothetical protein
MQSVEQRRQLHFRLPHASQEFLHASDSAVVLEAWKQHLSIHNST